MIIISKIKEFKTQVVDNKNYKLHYEEKLQITNKDTKILFEKEKEYLIPVNYEILEIYCLPKKIFKVSNKSIISYNGIKYSVFLFSQL